MSSGLIGIYTILLGFAVTPKFQPNDTELRYLLHETFTDGSLTEGMWNARLNLVERKDIDPTQSGKALGGLDNLGGGYLHFWDPRGSDLPFLYSLKTFERRPGRCLAVVHCGTIHRGGPITMQFAGSMEPQDRFSTGPGWAPGQFQGSPVMLNTAVPFDEGIRGPAQHNDNVDTLFLTVLRRNGAFYLASGEPTATPPRAKLCYVSHTGQGGPYHVALTGGPANPRFYSVCVMDLPGQWEQPFGIADVVDLFDRHELSKPDRGGTVWESTGKWTVRNRELICHSDGLVLTDAGSRDAYMEVIAVPGKETKMMGIVLRADGPGNLLRFGLTRNGARLVKRTDGQETEITASDAVKLSAGNGNQLAVRLEDDWFDLLVDDVSIGQGRISFTQGGTKVGLTASGGDAVFQEFVKWPLYVTIPDQLVGEMPSVPLKVDGEIILYDDFQDGDGPMDGRKPGIGQGRWKIHSGTWAVRDGAATLAESPGMALIDCGATDYEISATIDMVGDPDFPGFYARVSGPDADGQINARFLWQNASPEIEVWDRPAATQENVKRWARPEGGIPMVLINATNITYGARPGSRDLPGRIRPGEKHLLRLVVRGNRVSYFCDDFLVGTAPTRVVNGTWVGLGMSPHGNAKCRWLDFTVRAFE